MHAHINIQRYKSSAVFFYLIWTLSLEMSDEPDMIANNAEALIKAMEKDMNMSFFTDTGNFTPSYATKPEKPRRIVHQGDKVVYVEKNEGIINIS